MKKNLIIFFSSSVIFIMAIAIISYFCFRPVEKKSLVLLEGSNKVNLVCSNGYKAQAEYYSQNDQGIMEKLRLAMIKGGETTNYDMIPAMSASGAKFETADKKFSFWEHQGEFAFAENDEDLAICREVLDVAFTIEGESIKLVDGLSEVAQPDSAAKVVTRYFGNEVYGDFNSDGLSDAAFLVTQETGGSGTFFYLVAALKTADGYQGANAVLLGDRIAPQTTEIDETDSSLIVVNYADRKPAESFDIQPSQGVSRTFRVENGVLSEIVNKSSLTLESKEWVWVKTAYNNDTQLEPKKVGVFKLTFKGGKISASTDCNSISGAYTVDDNKLSFGKLASTRMYCQDSQEADFLKTLEETSSFFFNDRGELVLELKLDTGSAIFK